MSRNIILSGNAYNNFADTIKSQVTLKLYTYCITQFMKFLKVSDMDNLLVLAQDPKAIQQKIIDYISYLKKQKQLSAVSIGLYVAAIMHFYAMNDLTLNRKKIGRYIPERTRQHQDRAYTRNEIAKMVEFCDLRNRAIVLLFAATGMRIGAIPALSLEHLQRIEKYSLYQFTIYAGYPEEYICFCTPECAKAIDDYLEYRERCGEKLEPKSPLFRSQFDVNDQGDIRNNVKPVTKTTIVKMLSRILVTSGVQQVDPLKAGEIAAKKRKSVMRSHGFRKFVNTTMVTCRIDASVRNKLLGHSIGLDKSYWKPQVSDLLQEYLKVVDALTINEENRLRKQVTELTAEKNQLQEIRDQIDALNKKIGL